MRRLLIAATGFFLAACGGHADDGGASGPAGPAFTYDPDESWPQVGFGPGRSFTNPHEGKVGKGTATTLSPAWVGVKGSALSAPIIAGSWVFATTSAGTLEVVDAKDGSAKATIDLGSSAAGAPAYAGGYVFVTTKDKRLVAIDARALTIAWQAEHTGSLTPPVVSDTVVYVGSTSGYVYAYGADGCGDAHCLPDWAGPTTSPVHAPPAVAQDQVYVTSEDGVLRAYPAAGCGKQACPPAWSRRIGGSGNASPTAAGDRVFVAFVREGAPALAAFDAAGTRAWLATMSGTPTNLASDGTRVYATTSHGEIVALDARDGKTRWSSPSLGKITGAPAIANHALFVGVMSVDALPELLVFGDACGTSTCSPFARISTGKDTVGPSAPAICRGRIHVSNGGRLIALQPR